MALVPCTADTDTLDFEQDVSGNLIGNVRLDPAGGLTSTAAGIKVDRYPLGGLGLAGNQLLINGQSGGGIVADASGVIARQLFTYSGWRPGVNDIVSHALPISRGASAQVGPTITLPLSLAPTIANTVEIGFTWTVNLNTNITGLATAATLDAVSLSLQYNYDSAGWVNIDEGGFFNKDMAGIITMSGTLAASLANSTAHSISSRLIVTGGALSATAIQGTLNSSWMRGIYVFYPS